MTVTHFMQNEKFPTSKLVARKLVAGILYRFFLYKKKTRKDLCRLIAFTLQAGF